MNLNLIVSPSVEALSDTVAADTLAAITHAASSGRRILLGVPAGRTLVPVITALTNKLRAHPQSLEHVTIVMMDDYVLGREGEWAAPPATAHFSCRRFGEELRDALNGAVAPASGISADGLWSPDPRDPSAYDVRIAEAGGIDIFFVAVGTSDGHVAFNPPMTPIDSGTRIIPLAATTREDNLGTFPEFAELSDVPTHGITVGIATISAARRVEMIAHGASKQPAIQRVVDSKDWDESWPATFVYRHPDAVLRVDASAAPH